MEDVTPLLSKTGCYCLNERAPQEYAHLFAGDHTLDLRSDTDEQLLLHLAFNQTLVLKQIVLGLPPNETCPKTVRLFINQNSLGFSDAADTPATQIVTLEPPAGPNGGTVAIPLNVAKWQRTDSITIFVEDNHGADFTSFYSLKLYGNSVHSTDVSKIHQLGHETH